MSSNAGSGDTAPTWGLLIDGEFMSAGSGEVFTADLDIALAVSTRLRVGTVWVNTSNKTYPELPTGGFRQSGLARELGLEGSGTYLETKTVQLNQHGGIR